MFDKLKSNWGLLIFFIATFAVAWFGSQFPADQWYQGLNRAPWNPPNWLFPIAWSILYVLIAISGWLVCKAKDTTLQSLWWLQLLFNGLWSWLFFGLHDTALSLLDLLLLDALVVAFLYFAWRRPLMTVVWLWLPYTLWLLLATSLNFYIVLAN